MTSRTLSGTHLRIRCFSLSRPTPFRRRGWVPGSPTVLCCVLAGNHSVEDAAQVIDFTRPDHRVSINLGGPGKAHGNSLTVTAPGGAVTVSERFPSRRRIRLP